MFNRDTLMYHKTETLRAGGMINVSAASDSGRAVSGAIQQRGSLDLMGHPLLVEGDALCVGVGVSFFSLRPLIHG